MPAIIRVDRLTMDAKGIRELCHTREMADAAADWARTIANNVNRAAGSDVTNLAGQRSSRRMARAGGVGADPETVWGKVLAVDPGWHLIEYGTWSVEPRAPFRRGAEDSGVHYRDGGPDA